jgi:hypothetical protein
MPKRIGEIILYDLKELSEKLDITVVALRSYIREGRLKARKWGREWHVSEDALRDYFLRTDDPSDVQELQERIVEADPETRERVREVLNTKRVPDAGVTGSKSGNRQNRT